MTPDVTTPRLQPLVRARVSALGDEGQAWADNLPGVLGDLCRRWSLRLGRRLPGGSASHLTTVLRADESEAVLKVALPGSDVAGHASTLGAADGRGYVRLLEAEPTLGALLLERLGPTVDHLGLRARCSSTRWPRPWERPGVHRTGRLRTGQGRWPTAFVPATRSCRAWSGQRWSSRPWPAPRC